MGWSRSPGRAARDRRRPCLESLETRQLLSTVPAHPADSPASTRNVDGSIDFDRIIGASAARSAFGVDGSGMSVAVIDTGVNFQNAALGGGIGPGHKVVAGVDFTGSPNGVLPTWQHGTGVAGLIASDTPDYRGVAPGADIVALRVFGDRNQGSFANIAQALDWVVQHHTEHNTTAVNISISDGGNYTANDFSSDGGVGQAITRSIRQLDDLNIPVVVAAGNSFNGKAQGQGFPSIVSDAISVTATDGSDQLASNAQRLGSPRGGQSSTTLAAPGVAVHAPADGNNFQSEDGTSFATPQVTGGIVLLQQIYEKAFHKLPTVAQLELLLQQGSAPVHDDATRLDIGRLDILNSATILGRQIASVAESTAAVIVPNTAVQSSAGSTGTALATVPDPTPPVQDPAPPSTKAAPIEAAQTLAPSPPAQPQTEVFFNGSSIGRYATDRLSTRYSNLFSFLKTPVESIRIYGPKGTPPNLGASQPSGEPTATSRTSPKLSAAHSRAGSLDKAHALVVTSPRLAIHKPAAHHPLPISRSGLLFPFKR